MTKRVVLLLCILTLGLGTLAFADEGMWLFNHFPVDKVKAKYGFAPDQAWLDHVRLSSARAPNGSSSFVSADGLIFTNHHIAQGCVHDLSTNGKDYMKNGFYAPTRAEEPKCPGMEFVVLEGIEDVTDKVNAAAKPGMSTADAGKAQREEMSNLEKQCSTSGMRCDVVTLYSGAMYNLYKYKKYDDMRLVFAPEFDIAFFGGDPDNFEYPRYDLDISFLRAYENDQPAKINDYLKWSPTGVKEGDLVFVSGNPGRTQRLFTMDQLDFLRDVQYPWQLKSLARRIDMLQKFSAESAENAREAESDLFGLQNSFKAITGYQGGLLDKDLMAKKAADEKALQRLHQLRRQAQAGVRRSLGRNRQGGERPESRCSCPSSTLTTWPASAVSSRVTPAPSCAPPTKSRSPAISAFAAIRTRRCPRWSSGCSPPLRFTSRWTRFSSPKAWPKCRSSLAPTMTWSRWRWPASRRTSAPRS